MTCLVFFRSPKSPAPSVHTPLTREEKIIREIAVFGWKEKNVDIQYMVLRGMWLENTFLVLQKN